MENANPEPIKRYYSIRDSKGEFIDLIEIDMGQDMDKRIVSLTQSYKIHHHCEDMMNDSYLFKSRFKKENFFCLRVSPKGEIINAGYKSADLSELIIRERKTTGMERSFSEMSAFARNRISG